MTHCMLHLRAAKNVTLPALVAMLRIDQGLKIKLSSSNVLLDRVTER